jgi:hypothetical protein
VAPTPLCAESIILYLEAALADTIHEKRDHKPPQTAALDALVNVASYKYKELYERYYELTLQVGVAPLGRCHYHFSLWHPLGWLLFDTPPFPQRSSWQGAGEFSHLYYVLYHLLARWLASGDDLYVCAVTTSLIFFAPCGGLFARSVSSCCDTLFASAPHQGHPQVLRGA